MAKTNLSTTQAQQTTTHAPTQGETKAFWSAKKPRTTLAVTPAKKGQASRPVSASTGGALAGGDEVGLGSSQAGEAALARLRAELWALPPEQLRRINVYVPAAVAIALGTLPKLLGLREALRVLPGVLAALDQLEGYALATLYAHALTLPRSEYETELRVLLHEAAPLRERMLASAELLARFGLLDATRVASIRSGTGYLDTAHDLTALAAIFHAAWPEVASKSIVTVEEVNRAAELGPRLVRAIGRRQQGTEGAGEPGEAREQLSRAYTLFFNAYDECRRGVAFVRWREGDADAFAPTLRSAVRRPRPSDDVPADGETPEAEPGGEVPGDGTPGGRPGTDAPGGGVPGSDLPDDPGIEASRRR